jgi:hypothetical protein
LTNGTRLGALPVLHEAALHRAAHVSRTCISLHRVNHVTLTVGGPLRSTPINGHRQTAPACRVGAARKRHPRTCLDRNVAANWDGRLLRLPNETGFNCRGYALPNIGREPPLLAAGLDVLRLQPVALEHVDQGAHVEAQIRPGAIAPGDIHFGRGFNCVRYPLIGQDRRDRGKQEALMTPPRHERNAAFGAGAIVRSCMARVRKGEGEQSFRQGTRCRLGRRPSELTLLGATAREVVCAPGARYAHRTDHGFPLGRGNLRL